MPGSDRPEGFQPSAAETVSKPIEGGIIDTHVDLPSSIETSMKETSNHETIVRVGANDFKFSKPESTSSQPTKESSASNTPTETGTAPASQNTEHDDHIDGVPLVVTDEGSEGETTPDESNGNNPEFMAEYYKRQEATNASGSQETTKIASPTKSPEGTTVSLEQIQAKNKSELSLDEQLTNGMITQEQYDQQKQKAADILKAQNEQPEGPAYDAIGHDVTDEAIEKGALHKFPEDLDSSGKDKNQEAREAYIEQRKAARTEAIDKNIIEKNRRGETLSPEEEARLLEIDPEKKLESKDQAWKAIAASGDNPADAMIEYFDLQAEIDGTDKLSESEKKDFRNFMAEIYKEGVLPNLEGRNSRLIREKFIELGQIEAQMVALKGVVENMKQGEKKMKQDVDRAEDDYLSEKDPEERMKKLNIWRTKALRLEGYQIAINGQASRGRELNIKRRQAVGLIHRKLGTKGLVGNMIFGAVTAGHEFVDAFANVTVDQVRDRFA